MNYTSEQYSEAQKFCQVYFGTEEGVRLRAVSEREGCPQEVVKILEGSFEDKFIEAWALSGKGYAIYYMPQMYTPGEWQEKYANLLGFYGVVVDLDGTDVKKAVEHVVKDLGAPRPTIIVESSNGHYQVCWRFSKPASVGELSVDTFNTLAFNLAAAMGGDFNAARATQPFRLPGFINQKVGRDEWVCRIAWINEDEGKEGVLWQDMVAWSGMPQVAGEAGRAAGERRGLEWSGQEVDLAAVRLGEVKVGEGDRHRVLIRLATQLCEEFDSEEKVTSELDKVVSSSFTGAGEFLEGGKRREELRKAVRDAEAFI